MPTRSKLINFALLGCYLTRVIAVSTINIRVNRFKIQIKRKDLLVVAHIDQGPIQRDHVTGHQIELVLLELLLHQGVLLGRNLDRLAHLPGTAVHVGHKGRGPPELELLRPVGLGDARRGKAVQVVVRVDLVLVHQLVVRHTLIRVPR